MTRRPLTLPAITPSEWELKLPGYPVISGTWRSSAFPELLGNLPNGSTWRMVFRHRTSAEALALSKPWRATAGGQWPLTKLPDQLSAGVNDADFRKRLTGTTWTISSEPKLEPVKNGRFDIAIELEHELTFDSVYGPGDTAPPQLIPIPVLLREPAALTVLQMPSTTSRIHNVRPAQAILYLSAQAYLGIEGAVATTRRLGNVRQANNLMLLKAQASLQIIPGASNPALLPELKFAIRNAQAAINLGIASALKIHGNNSALLDEAPPAGSTDPAFASNVLLLPFIQATSNSTGFEDYSSNAHMPTIIGAPTIAPSGGRFGGSSAVFDGTSYIHYQSMQSLTADFTIEIDCRPSTIERILFSTNFGASNPQGFRMFPNGQLSFFWDGIQIFSDPGAVATNVHQRLALSRVGGVLRMYVENSQVGPAWTNWFGPVRFNIIGIMFFQGGANPGTGFIGSLSQVRIRSIGTTSFPPIAPFPLQ